MGASLTNVLSPAVALELRAGFETGRQEFFGNDTALTVVADGPAAWGTDPSAPRAVRPHRIPRRARRFTSSLGRQRLKIGGAFNYNSFRDTYAYNRTGSFAFGGPDELVALDGGYAQTVGREPIGKFSAFQFGGFIQNRWQVVPGADFVAGFRVDWERVDRRGTGSE